MVSFALDTNGLALCAHRERHIERDRSRHRRSRRYREGSQ